MKVVLRTDASLLIGTGHVIRCLTLARRLRDFGAQCLFICRQYPGSLQELILNSGFNVVVLPTTNDESVSISAKEENKGIYASYLGVSWETDAKQTINAISNFKVDLLIVDHYALDYRWEELIQSKCKQILVIDDLANRAHNCNLLLDQNLFKNINYRYKNRVSESCRLMLGPDYALLQPQFAKMRSKTKFRKGPVQRILVYFGGADLENITGKTIAAYLSIGETDVVLDVVINPANPNAPLIRQQVEGHKKITLYEGVPSLASLIATADLAIGAGGTTSWERCCLGLPSYVITIAENQIPIVIEMERKGLIRWLGHKDQISEIKLVDIFRQVIASTIDSEWSERCWRLVDGLGTDRVVSVLMLSAKTKLKARLARQDDEDKILRWANDPLVRKNSFSPNIITPEAHRAWFIARLSNFDHCQLYVVETSMRLPIGQVRFEKCGGKWEVHYTLDALARGRGLGKSMLLLAISTFSKKINGIQLIGRVKQENIASCRIFEALGFRSEANQKGEIVYSKAI